MLIFSLGQFMRSRYLQQDLIRITWEPLPYKYIFKPFKITWEPMQMIILKRLFSLVKRRRFLVKISIMTSPLTVKFRTSVLTPLSRAKFSDVNIH